MRTKQGRDDDCVPAPTVLSRVGVNKQLDAEYPIRRCCKSVGCKVGTPTTNTHEDCGRGAGVPVTLLRSVS